MVPWGRSRSTTQNTNFSLTSILLIISDPGVLRDKSQHVQGSNTFGEIKIMGVITIQHKRKVVITAVSQIMDGSLEHRRPI